MKYSERIKRFIIVGISAFIINAVLLILFVEGLGFTSYLQKNIANFLSMEISIFYNFLVSRGWTWRDAPKKKEASLLMQFFAFNFAALAGVLIRTILFAFLEAYHVYYLINLTIGVGIAAAFDFILYDKLIFRRQTNE